MKINSMRRKGLILLATIALAIVLGACVAPVPEKPPYKIGVIMPQTGPASHFGKPILDGARAMAEKINKEGGIDGYHLELILYDSESSESKAVIAAKKAINVDKVHALILDPSTGPSLAVAPIAEEAEVPMVTTSIVSILDKPVRKWVFRPMTSEANLIPLLFGYWQRQNISRIAVLIQRVAVETGGKFIKEYAPRYGMDIVAWEIYKRGDTDITPQLAKIKGSDAQAILNWGGAMAGGLAVKQAREMEIKLPIGILAALATPQIIGAVGKYYEIEPSVVTVFGKLAVWRGLPETDPDKAIYREFDEFIREKYGRPATLWDGLGAQTIGFIEDALKRARPDPAKLEEARKEIRDAFENTKNLKLFTGTFTMSPTDHHGCVKYKDLLVTFKDGKWIPIE